MTTDRFKILRRISLGPMTELLQAVDRLEGREVLLCRLHGNLADDVGHSRHFRDWGQLSGGLQHPALLPVLAHDATSGWFTMPWTEGVFLGELLTIAQQTGVRVPVTTVFALIGQLLDLLQYLEAVDCPRGRKQPLSITHGNLGPETIRWTSTQQVQVVALTGKVHGVPHDLTGIGVADQGAPYRTDDGGSTVHADRYALAALAFELLTGQVWRDVRATRAAEDALAAFQPGIADWLRRGLMTGDGEGFSSAREMAIAFGECEELVGLQSGYA